MTPPTLLDALERAATVPSTGLSVLNRREEVERRSWSDVLESSRRAAGALHELGVDRGDRVGLVYPTGFEFMSAFFGSLLAGAVPVPLYPPVRLGRLAEYHARTATMLTAVDAVLLLGDERTRRILGETVERARPRLGCLTLAELGSGEARPSSPRPDDLALIQFSSGTTVAPKPVALTHRAIMTQVETLNRLWPERPGRKDSGVSWLPLYHDMGLIGCIFPAIERPGDLTLIPPELFVAKPAVWLRTLSRTGATISPAPNFAYGLCVEKIADDELTGVDLSRWRIALNGGETVVSAVAKAFCDRFAAWGFRREAMTPVYGLAEATLAVTFSDLSTGVRSRRFSRDGLAKEKLAREDPAGREIVSVGRPLPDCAVSVRDPTGSELGERRVGAVWVTSPSVMSGYFGDQAATASVLRDGWLDTGDLGFLDDGELFLTGRAKDVLIVRGQNHAPEEVEHAVDGVPGVRTGRAAAVTYLPEGAAGENLLLLVERRRRRASDAEDAQMASRCRTRVLAATGLEADRVEILAPGALPRTSSGKIRRAEALRLYLAGELSPPASTHPLHLLGMMARSRAALRRAARSASNTGGS